MNSTARKTLANRPRDWLDCPQEFHALFTPVAVRDLESGTTGSGTPPAGIHHKLWNSDGPFLAAFISANALSNARAERTPTYNDFIGSPSACHRRRSHLQSCLVLIRRATSCLGVLSAIHSSRLFAKSTAGALAMLSLPYRLDPSL